MCADTRHSALNNRRDQPRLQNEGISIWVSHCRTSHCILRLLQFTTSVRARLQQPECIRLPLEPRCGMKRAQHIMRAVGCGYLWQLSCAQAVYSQDQELSGSWDDAVSTHLSTSAATVFILQSSRPTLQCRVHSQSLSFRGSCTHDHICRGMNTILTHVFLPTD